MIATLFRRLALAAAVMTFCVIVFGAFVRLSNAGLSCPDWPTCYGQITWPTHPVDIDSANAMFERSVESHKTWREQLHRHLAAALGLLTLLIALISAWNRPHGILRILTPALLIALSIPLYIKQQYLLASVLAIAGELLLLWAARIWSNADYARLGALILAVIVFQALLGMWTVTWLLKPVVVTAHLLGGMATFALLSWLTLRTYGIAAQGNEALLKRSAVIAGLILLVVQIALGGWTSANYAAWSCGTDFPTCLGEWWPTTDFKAGFVLWRGIGVDYEGGVLDGPARTAIQLSHRLFAVLVAGHLTLLAIKAIKLTRLRIYGYALLCTLTAQIGLGIANVKLSLPLPVAAAHNGVAALLLLVVVALLARITPAVRS